MQKIDEILKQLLSQRGWSDRLKTIQAVEIYNQMIREHFKELTSSQAVWVENGILSIQAENSVVLYEIFLKKNDLIQTLNQLMKEKIITDIAVKIGG